MKQLLLFCLFAISLTPALAQDPAQPINNGLMEMRSNYRLYSKRDSSRLDSLYRGTIGGGYLTYSGGDARYRRILAPLDYNLDISNKPVLFSGNYSDLANKPLLGTLSTQNAGSVNIGGGTAALSWLNMSGYNSTAPQLRVGSLEIQGADANQSFIGHNVHYEDGDFRRRTADPAGYFGFQNNEGQFRLDNGGVAGSYSSSLSTKAQMKIAYNGTWGVGANIPIEQGVFDGASMVVNGPTGNVLIGTTVDAPSSLLTLSSTFKGVLFPRLTTSQVGAISLPVEGLWLYDSTLHAYKYWNGTIWKIVATTN